ncbi:MAG: hypothetical protein ACTSPO_15985, partial [Candidatus Heimdallarchaeaceae archaeon]
MNKTSFFLAICLIILFSSTALAVDLDNSGGGDWERYLEFSLENNTYNATYMIKIDQDLVEIYNAKNELLKNLTGSTFWEYVQDDGDDVRLTAVVSGNEQQVYFTKETWDSTNNLTEIFVTVPADTDKIKLYFANPSATKSDYENASKTYLKDDYETNTLGGYTVVGSIGWSSGTVDWNSGHLYTNRNSGRAINNSYHFEDSVYAECDFGEEHEYAWFGDEKINLYRGIIFVQDSNNYYRLESRYSSPKYTYESYGYLKIKKYVDGSETELATKSVSAKKTVHLKASFINGKLWVYDGSDELSYLDNNPLNVSKVGMYLHAYYSYGYGYFRCVGDNLIAKSYAENATVSQITEKSNFEITSYSPSESSIDLWLNDTITERSQGFSITTNKDSTHKWYVNDNLEQTNTSVTTSSFTYSFDTAGTYTVKA